MDLGPADLLVAEEVAHRVGHDVDSVSPANELGTLRQRLSLGPALVRMEVADDVANAETRRVVHRYQVETGDVGAGLPGPDAQKKATRPSLPRAGSPGWSEEQPQRQMLRLGMSR